MPTLAVTTTTIEPVCPACGRIKNSGKASCCARGGSWFGNCGSVGNANVGHTWYEGVRVCTEQFKVVVGQQLHGSDDAIISMDSKAVYVFTSANTWTPVPGATPITVSANTSTITGARKSIADYAATAGNMSKPKRIFNRTIPSLPNETVGDPIHSPSAGISMRTPSHASASTSITFRKCDSLLHVVGLVSMVLISACCY